MKKSLIALVVIAFTLSVPLSTFGATLKSGEDLSISSNSSILGNAYLVGGAVTVNDPVEGDLFVAGGNVLVTENVSKDLAAAGGSVTILGDTLDDVRVAGGNVMISGNIGGELVVTGGSVHVTSGVKIGGDVVVAGGQVSVDGDIGGNAMITAGVASLGGNVAGDVEAMVEEKLTLGDQAVVGGNLVYKARVEDKLRMSDSALVVGEITFTESKVTSHSKNDFAAAMKMLHLVKLLIVIVSALVIGLLFRRLCAAVVNEGTTKALRSIGVGFVSLVVVPVASIVLLITIVGAPLGFISLVGYVFLLLLSTIASGIVFGAWLSKMIYKLDEAKVTWKNIIGGVFILGLIGFIPVLGPVIKLLVFLVTFGSLSSIAHQKLWRNR